MKPVVTAFKAWSCIILSLFAITILSVLALLFNASHHSMMSSTSDPVSGPAVARTCLGAIGVYGVRIAVVLFAHFCYMSVMGGRKRVKEDMQVVRGEDIGGSGTEVEGMEVYEGERGIALRGGEVIKG